MSRVQLALNVSDLEKSIVKDDHPVIELEPKAAACC